MQQTLSWTKCTPGIYMFSDRIDWRNPHTLRVSTDLGTSNFTKNGTFDESRTLIWGGDLSIPALFRFSLRVAPRTPTFQPENPVSKVAERARKPRLGWCGWHDFWIYKWAIKKSWLLIVLGIAAAEILPNYISDYNKPFKEIPKNPTMGPWKCHVGGFWSMSGWHYLAAWDQTIAYTWGAPGPPEGRVIQIPCKVGSWWCFGTSPAMSGKFRLVKCYEKFGQMLSNQYKFTRNDPLTLTLQRNCALLW